MMAPKRLDLDQRLTRIEVRLDAIDAAIEAIRAQRLLADPTPPTEEGQIARLRRLNAEARARRKPPQPPAATPRRPAGPPPRPRAHGRCRRPASGRAGDARPDCC
jgi:hypothetical protein